jgi:hypothetical protein
LETVAIVAAADGIGGKVDDDLYGTAACIESVVG